MARLIPARGEMYLDSNPGAEKAYRLIFGKAASGSVDVDSPVGTTDLWTVKAGTLITKVMTRVRIAFTGSVTITIGDNISAAGFLASADIAPTSAVTTGVMINSLDKGEAYDFGIESIGSTIQAVVAGATPVAGLLDIVLFAVPPQVQATS